MTVTRRLRPFALLSLLAACSQDDHASLFAAGGGGSAGFSADASRGVSARAGALGSSGAPGAGNAGDAAGRDAQAGTPGAGNLGNGGSAGASTAPGDDAGTGSDAGARGRAPRHFRLATTGAQLVVANPPLGLQLTPANLDADADVIAVHQEFYGVPWAELEAGNAPPAEWTRMMDGQSRAARSTGKPVFLSITMLNGTRESLAPKTTIESGQVKTQDNWSARCYDFAAATDAAAKRAAYLKYVQLMIDTFAPSYLNVAIEANLFFEKCPAATPGLIDLMNAAYDTAKAKSRQTVVFPSIQIDHLYGYSKDSCKDETARASCFDAAYATLAGIKRDRFAMSSYPYLSGFTDPATIPADWFTRGAARGAEKPLIAETGWLSTDLSAKTKAGACQTVFDMKEATAAAYLARVLGAADDMDLVTWWSDRDLLPSWIMTECPCQSDATWCSVVDIFRGPAPTGSTDTQLLGEVLMKAFGTMGLRLYDGTPKPLLYPLWSAARARPSPYTSL